MDAGRQAAPGEGRDAVSSEIRALMGRHRVTQTSLAEYLGMSQSALSERLSGSVPWNVDDLLGIARRFHVDPGTLFASVPPIFLVSSISGEGPCMGQLSLNLPTWQPAIVEDGSRDDGGVGESTPAPEPPALLSA